MGSDQVKIVYSQRPGCKNTSGFLASEMATWSLPNTFLQWVYRLVLTSIIYSLTFVDKIAWKGTEVCQIGWVLLILTIELRPSWALLVP